MLEIRKKLCLFRIDKSIFESYNKHKLKRFTGVPLTFSGVWRLTLKTKTAD